MFKKIYNELAHHAPFTFVGAVSGIVLIFLFRKMPAGLALQAFYVLHPFHVVLSALVTASMYEMHKCSKDRRHCNIWVLLFIGYTGSIGIATLSDSVIPYMGEVLLGMPHSHPHIGFIEKWWLVNPLAILGIAIAYFRPATKFPHAGHVFVSTWASLFHVLAAIGEAVAWWMYLAIFIFLFLAVWLPCCISDIVFPLLFIKNKNLASNK
ncbi:MAG: hypothetical protein JW928_06735 [Candidatus Aureabacteria bacterium]|nr:hypothetical protein [Candidatus Auribacterota bacterium]